MQLLNALLLMNNPEIWFSKGSGKPDLPDISVECGRCFSAGAL